MLAFPFVKLFQNNQLVCFEIIATVLSQFPFLVLFCVSQLMLLLYLQGEHLSGKARTVRDFTVWKVLEWDFAVFGVSICNISVNVGLYNRLYFLLVVLVVQVK